MHNFKANILNIHRGFLKILSQFPLNISIVFIFCAYFIIVHLASTAFGQEFIARNGQLISHASDGLFLGFVASSVYGGIIILSRLLSSRDYGLYTYSSDNMRTYSSTGKGVYKGSIDKPLPDSEFHRFAIHESGHILSYALYNEIPDTIEAWVRPYKTSPNGCVSGSYLKAEPYNVEHLLSVMKSQLAGSCAEAVVFGNFELGSLKDFSDWEQNARDYLGCVSGHDYMWFMKPSSKVEVMCNAETLSELKSRQRREVVDFLQSNKPLLLAVAEELKNTDMLDTAIIKGFISKAESL